MTARTPQLRKKTARELAEKFGVSPRTIRNHVAAPRDWWTQHRRELRQKAARLRATGMTWREVGNALGMTESAARAAGRRAAGHWASSGLQPERDTTTLDLFSGGPEAASSGPKSRPGAGPADKPSDQ